MELHDQVRVEYVKIISLQALSACLRLEPNCQGALHELAHAYAKLDAGNIANVVLEAALEYPGSRSEALATLVSVNIELGDRGRAKRWAQLLEKEAPELAAHPRVAALLDESAAAEPTRE